MSTKSDKPAAEFEPYIPASSNLSEFRALPIIFGTILGLIFGASSVYLVLKVGMTVSASIPVAVISIAFFRMLSKVGMRDATVLENNIVQTAGSAGESIAFGVGVTMPAILILGFDLEVTRVILVSVLGGLLGILMMIPLRRALIVQQHGALKYPEGTACAELLKTGASHESQAAAARGGPVDNLAKTAAVGAKTIFVGFALGALYNIVMKVFHAWKDVPEKVFGPDSPLKKGSISCEISPELLGVGYVIGPRIGCIMLAGGVLSYLLLIPLIAFFGDALAGPLPPGETLITKMTPNEMRSAYVLYIGAGAVAAGGLISVMRSLPLIWRGVAGGFRNLGAARGGGQSVLRTDRDLSMKFVFAGIVALVAAIYFSPGLHMNIIGAVMVVLCGFLFVTVSSRLTGEIGSSSNPISGMTIATLLITCLAFLALGWTERVYYITALSVGGIVCIASSNGGTTSQDLKTGHLLGATPRYQQLAILIGALVSALALGPILLMLNDAGKVYVPMNTELHTDVSKLTEKAMLTGPRAKEDGKSYFVWNKKDEDTGDFRQYFVDETGKAVYLVEPGNDETGKIYVPMNIELRTDVSKLTEKATLTGPQAKEDGKSYFVWHKEDEVTGNFRQYFVDETGKAVYLVDPGINGTKKKRPDGSEVRKFDAPKTVLVSYIIKGILSQKLPWTLMLFGVMIAIVLELVGIPSLAFAVGVYIGFGTSTAIFAGGVIRWLVDSKRRKHPDYAHMTEEEHIAEGDKSPGVLMASGYIAGGIIAGIVIALMTGVLSATDKDLDNWSKANNPFYSDKLGWSPDLLSMIPFVAIAIILYLAGSGKILAGKKT